MATQKQNPSLQGRLSMSVLRRLAVLTLTAVLATTAVAAADDDSGAYSGAPTAIELCGGDDPMAGSDGCTDGSFAKFSTDLDHGLQAALVKAPANVRPLLKRDQYWFAEMLANAIQDGVPRSKTQADREAFTQMLQRRLTTLAQIAQGFGRPGLAGTWEDAFGSVAVTPAENGFYRLAIDTDSGVTGSGESRFRCRANAQVRPAGNGWFAGELVFEPRKPEDGDTPPPLKPLPLKLRRQGETLRIVAAEPFGPVEHGRPESCKNPTQITGSYFASGKSDANDKSDTAFVAPSLDCLRPVTASDEEICADPDLALGDVRLNRAWKALLPRLDETTRRALTEDQRLWLRQQAGLYGASIHPGGDKVTYDQHHLGYARFMLDKLQRERIALLEGFDENRKGLAGLWLGHNAILDVTPAEGGGVQAKELQAKGRKWEWDDYKAGCDYDMQGKIAGGAFRASEQGKNPDTLERDHATLIVNRLDDAFAKQRHGAEDEMKCRRSMQASSTVRLFPVRTSADIDKSGDWH
jgi:hypothetical protein